MLKKNITYTDYNGKEIEETFYFHLSKPELVDMDVSAEGGLANAVERIMETNDRKQLIDNFKMIIGASIGQKSADGRNFRKSDEIRLDFESSPAYEILYMELATDDEAAAEFLIGALPNDLGEQVAKAKKEESPVPATVPQAPPFPGPVNRS